MSELGRLAETLERLARIPAVASTEAASGIATAIDHQFDAQVDPYGRPWAKLAESTIAKKGDDAILQDTGHLRETIDVRPMRGAGIQVTMGAEYAGFHQVGTVTMPKRLVLPDGRIPDTWDRAISDALDHAWERAS